MEIHLHSQERDTNRCVVVSGPVPTNNYNHLKKLQMSNPFYRRNNRYLTPRNSPKGVVSHYSLKQSHYYYHCLQGMTHQKKLTSPQ